MGGTNTEETEEVEKERKIETDDPEALQKARDMDDFKDGLYYSLILSYPFRRGILRFMAANLYYDINIHIICNDSQIFVA